MTDTNRCLEHDTWEKAYKMIKLENSLCNHRVMMIMIINAFLFIAFILSISSMIALKSNKHMHQDLENLSLTIWLAISVVICIVGAVSSCSIKEGIYAAYLQIVESKNWLEAVTTNHELLQQRPYPPIVGKKLTPEDYESIRKLSSGNLIVPKVLTYVWCSFFLIDLFFILKLTALPL
jgi:heme/copper-type cytochrome/quinol oxidase subunit 2